MSVQLTNHIAVMHRQIEELKCHMNIRRSKVSLYVYDYDKGINDW